MKVLISAYTGLGNFILKTPFIKKLKQLYPCSIIDIIAGNSFGTEFVLQNSELINKTLILNEKSSIKEKINFFINLRKDNYDLIFLPFDANSKFFGSYLAKIKSRIVHVHLQNRFRTYFFNTMPSTLLVPLLQGRHEIDLNLEAYYNKPFERNYSTFINCTKESGVLDKFSLEKFKYVVLQVGAANGTKSAKKWSIKNYRTLIEKFNLEYKNYKVVTVGDKGDYENDIKELENTGLKFINTAGLTSLEDVSNILYYSKLVVANDSGIMHIANALDSNLIALYGPTDYTRTRPLSKNSRILFSKTDCFCKMYNFSGDESKLLEEYPNCMDGITVEAVMVEVNRIINSDK